MARHRQKAQALVEYALVFPVLVLVLVGMTEVGRYFLAWHQAGSCARAGAREACLWWPPDTKVARVVSAVQHYAQRSSASRRYTIEMWIGTSNTTYTYTYNGTSGSWNNTPPLPQTGAGVPVKFRVTIPFQKLWPRTPLPNQVSVYEIRYTQGIPQRL